MKQLCGIVTALSGHTYLWRALFITSLGVISWLAFTGAPPELAQMSWDKFNHVLAFAALGLGAWLSAPQIKSHQRVLGLLLYGLLIEGVQGFLPSRSASGLDILADLVGLACGEGGRLIIQWMQSQAPRLSE